MLLLASVGSAQATLAYAWSNFVGQPGVSGFADGTGSAARFAPPYGVAVDNSGNVFVAGGSIRKVTSAGVVTTLAGGVTGYGVAVDSAGNVYVADTDNNTIRKVTPAGVVTTLAGSPGVSGTSDGTGSAARFYAPFSVAVDNSGNVYVADSSNYTIRKVTSAGVVTTLAGSPGVYGNSDGTGSAARFKFPCGVAVDSAGNVYVADYGNSTIRKVSANGVVTTLAGSAGSIGSMDGTGTAARFLQPRGVAVDGSGNVYVADTYNTTIRKVTPAGVVTTIGGTAGSGGSADGTGSEARFSYPFGVAVDSAGNLYVADHDNFRISKGLLLAPKIVLEQPAGTGIAVGSTQTYGATLVGATKTMTFVIRNIGTGTLTSLSLSITGASASQYVMVANPPASVVAGGSTTFTVAFTPGSTGPKAATLHITGEDIDPFDITLSGNGGTTLAASYATGADIPATANGFTATGKTANFSLNYAPASGANLMVLNNTGPGFINGTFNNLAQGQTVALGFNGTIYNFVANYYGGSGNDLVLQWAGTRLAAWGANDAGTLGNNSRTGSLVPVPVKMSGILSGKTIIAVACAENHSLALCADGTLAAWGANSSGQLGNNSTTDSLVPVQVNASAGSALFGKTVVAIAAGCDFSVALCSDGTVAAWGLNGSGQLGDTTKTQRLLPVPVNASAGSALAGKTVGSVAAAKDFCLAVCSDGSVAAWGANSCGQLGNNSTADSQIPVAVNATGALSGKTVASVAAGYYHSLAVCTDGTLAAWGDNSFGELGTNNTASSLVPALVNTDVALSGKTPVSVGAGEFHSIALCADGTLVTWGDNSYGQLGLSGPGYSRAPVAINNSGALSGKTVVSVASGHLHNVALLAGGALAAWGDNTSGQLGNGNADPASLPVAVSTTTFAAGESIVDVASGPTASHSIGVVAIPLASLAGPAATTNSATGLTKTGATLQGVVNPNGLDTDVCFEYGPTAGYGNTTAPQSIGNGNANINVQAAVSGLQPNTAYHFRIKATNTSGSASGNDTVFTTVTDPPSAVTEAAVSIAETGATLAGRVNPNGRITSVRFEYGLTASLGNTIAVQDIPAGFGDVEVTLPLTGLSSGTTYYYRIVATNTGGIVQGDTLSFIAATAGSIPTAPPAVSKDSTTDITTTGATMRGIINPNGGMTDAHFEYGTTTGYGSATASLGAGSGNTQVNLSAVLSGLQPGTLYHYRLVAQNSLGTTPGPDTTFTTLFLPPAATTGGSALLSTTSVRVSGTVRAHNASTQVFFDYGTDGVNFPISVSANPAIVSGDADTAATGDLLNLQQGTTFFYRVRATSVGGTTTGTSNSFNVAILSGLTQVFPPAPPAASGNVTVTLIPSGINSGWRFVGEQQWRASGLPVGGLTAGNRQIEYRPVPGYIKPLQETIIVSSGTTLVTGQYYPTPGSATGGMSVVLKPDTLADAGLPVGQRAQWRFLGEDDTQWRNSGVTVSGLPAGNYLVESKPLTGQATPAVINVSVDSGATKVATATYFLAGATAGTTPSVLPFNTVSTSQTLPYAYVGQIRSDLGSATGFVVKPRVVATAAHVVFDDGTLSYVSSLQWLFQRDLGTYEPTPQIPRGFYVFDGYATQRTTEASPGVSTPQSQNLDAAALYFLEDAGRGGYGGWLASDLDNNEFLLSTKMKMLVGYPVDGIATLKQGRMHATPAANITFAKAFGRTFTTTDIRSAGGNSGGPLCVQADNGNYYPAAIYLGGSGQTVVRAIDSQVIDLFNRAEVSANGGDDHLGGGIITIRPPVIAPPPAPASLQVSIEPAGAVAAGATWNVGGAACASGASISLPAGTYTLTCTGASGFMAPVPSTITLSSGQGASVSRTYSGITVHPAGLTAAAGGSATFSVGVSGTPSAYQWRRNGTDIPGATSSTYTRSNLTATDTGNYSVVVTWGGSGSLTSNAAALDVTAASGFDAWRALNFTATELLDALKSGPAADYDHDGICNLLEYALNLDPKTADATTMIAGTGTGGLPLVRVENVSGQNRLTVEFVRRKAASTPGITYAVEFSSNLSNTWSATGTETTTPIDATWERVKTTDQQNSSPYRFTRLKVTQP